MEMMGCPADISGGYDWSLDSPAIYYHFLCNNMIDNKEEVSIEEAYLFSLTPS
jgi:hypothetical protein